MTGRGAKKRARDCGAIGCMLCRFECLFLLTTYLRPRGIGMFLPHMSNATQLGWCGVGWGEGDDNVPCIGTHVQSATEWTASVQTLHMPKHVM